VAVNNIYTQSVQDSAALAYVALLGRNPSFQEYFSALKDLSVGGSSASLALDRKIGQTSEFVADYAALTNTVAVTFFYNNILQRSPSPAELAAVTDLLNGGSRAPLSTIQVATQFYNSVLQRSPNPAELAALTNLLNSAPSITKQDLFFLLASSIMTGGGSSPGDSQLLKNKVTDIQNTLYAQAQNTPLGADQVSMVLAVLGRDAT
jgi:hypothetical protein